MVASSATGIGLGLRAAFIDEVLEGEADGRVAFLEIAPENYMRRGGRTPQKLVELSERFSVLSHGLMMSLGSTDRLDEDYLATLRPFLAQCGTPHHSDHVCWSGIGGRLMHDLLPVAFTSRSARRIADRIRHAEDRLGVPMAIENISWYLQLGEPSYAETDFLCEILDRADCGLMLDVNNVFVNAANHGFDATAWIDEMPLDRVVQLHVAGHDPGADGLIIDTHGQDVRPEVCDLMAHTIERTGPKPVVLERDGNFPPLSALLDEVATLQRVYDSALDRYLTAAGSPSRHGS